MFCSNCGKEVRDEAKFCSFCGAKLSPQQASECTDKEGLNSWEKLKSYLTEKYEGFEEDKETGILKTIFNIDDERSQSVFLEKKYSSSGEILWLEISSLIGEHISDFEGVCQLAGEYLVGGIVKEGDGIYLRSNTEMATANFDTISKILEIVCQAADEIEAKFIGGDNY